jgi:DNA-directed RNA polymerase subunit RPC12/RpoP
MALSVRLLNVDLTLECERCGHLIVKRGGSFITVSIVKCAECKGEVRLTYSDKVALFAKHGHLA